MPLPAASVTAAGSAEPVIPDCCNVGVVFRTLVAVNALALAVKLLQAPGWRLGLLAFVEASMLVELSCLWSLFALCGVRRLIRRVGAGVPAWVQRSACAAIPAAVTGIIVHLFTASGVVSGSGAITTGAGALVAALLGALAQHYFELRTRAYSPALVEARLQALQARIRPHFLFNSLNAALSLIRTEPRRAETVLEDLADLFRVLMKDPRNMTTLESEIRLCEQYLSIEKVRLGERLQVRWEMESIGDEVLRRARVPVLLLQPLLENAVRYGVEPAVVPVEVVVRVARAVDRIEITVVNPFAGDKPAVDGNHMALDNIRERLALLYDVEAQLTTAERPGQFEVRIRFPYVREGA